MTKGKKLQKSEELRKVRSLEKESTTPKHLKDYVPAVAGGLAKSVPIALGARLLFDFYSLNSDLKKIEECKEIIRTSNSAEVREEAKQTLERLSKSIDKRFYINMGLTGLLVWLTR